MEKEYDEAGRVGVKVPSLKDVLGKKHPEKKFKAGAITATIWLNHKEDDKGNKTSFRTVSFEKNYMDKNGNWQSNNVLRVSDVPKGQLVLQKAYEYIMLRENQNEEDHNE